MLYFSYDWVRAVSSRRLYIAALLCGVILHAVPIVVLWLCCCARHHVGRMEPPKCPANITLSMAQRINPAVFTAETAPPGLLWELILKFYSWCNILARVILLWTGRFFRFLQSLLNQNNSMFFVENNYAKYSILLFTTCILQLNHTVYLFVWLLGMKLPELNSAIHRKLVLHDFKENLSSSCTLFWQKEKEGAGNHVKFNAIGHVGIIGLIMAQICASIRPGFCIIMS